MKKNLILISLILISLTACKELNGTDVDNPFQGQEEPCQGKSRCMPTPYVIIQTGVICEKVNQCLGVADNSPAENCSKLLPDQNGLESFLNTPAANYSELNQLYNAKKLTVNAGNWNNCLSAIQDLDCNSPEFNNSFNVNNSTDYTNIHQILLSDAKCTEIYEVKATP